MTGSVLVVDDDPEFRALTVGLLRDWGHEPLSEAATIAEARTALSHAQPDALLLDIRLPDGNGYTLAAELAALEDPPRVVLVSGDSDAGDDTRARRVGAVGFVVKHELFDGRLRALIAGS